MAIAGKVAITLATENGGAWSADVTYDRLVAVKHNNNLYISRKTVANVEPPNDEFWFLALEGFGGDDVQALIDRLNELSDLIQAIITGTTQVGNAKTLDGHGADVFLPKKNGVIPKGTSLFFEKDNNSTLSGNVRFEVNGDYLRISENGGKSRGVVVKLSDCADWIGSMLLHSGNISNYAFMPTGGDIGNGKNPYPIFLKGYNSYSLIEYGDENRNKFGLIGFNGIDNPVILTADKTKSYTILHTGNKPTGTYTGNGDATERQINVGGIGYALLVSTGTDFAILTNDGAIVKEGTTITALSSREAKFNNGNIYIATTNSVLNLAGGTRYFALL